MNKLLKITVLFIPFILLSCLSNTKHPPVKSFCYWKTSFNLDSTDAADLKNLNVNHLYLRFFDVDWNAVTMSPMPVAECDFSYSYQYQTDITPTIFITNVVFENINDKKIDELATHVAHKIDLLKNKLFESLITWGNIYKDSKYKELEKTDPYNWTIKNNFEDSMMKILKPEFCKRNNEILIDCDWTPSTKNKYFKLLELLKAKMPESQISSTLRLWQYRDYKLAGVPPVTRCLLMCYNLTDPRKYETENSIATFEEFKKYITHSDYPKKLDIALPIHSWAIYFRNNKFKGIVNGISVEEMNKNKELFSLKADNRYMFLKDTVIEEVYYRYGDEFRVEQVDYKTLMKFAALIRKYINTNDKTRVSFFSWDANFYNRFTKDEYNQILNTISE